MSQRIIYLCPATARPSGGVKRLHRHVAFLREAGFDAYIGLAENAPKIEWFDNTVPVVNLKDFAFCVPDIVVVPDAFIHVIKPVINMDVRKVVLCLGFISPFFRFDKSVSWMDYNIEEVIVNNPEIGSFLNYTGIWNKKCHAVETGIDKNLYFPEKKKFQIAYLNKHDDRKFEMLEKILYLRAMNHERNFIEFVELKGLSEEKYAKVLRESVIFACGMACEGYSVPILEAMASGCLCVGSHGVGGNEFVFNDVNFLEVPYGDIFAYARVLQGAMDMVEDKSLHSFMYPQILEQAQGVAALYTIEREKESVLDFWKSFIATE